MFFPDFIRFLYSLLLFFLIPFISKISYTGMDTTVFNFIQFTEYKIHQQYE